MFLIWLQYSIFKWFYGSQLHQNYFVQLLIRQQIICHDCYNLDWRTSVDILLCGFYNCWRNYWLLPLQYLCSFNKGCHDPFNCTALKCYGTFLHTVIAGWDDKECIRTFETISQNTLMIRHLESIVKYKAGHHKKIIYCRLTVCRCYRIGNKEKHSENNSDASLLVCYRV